MGSEPVTRYNLYPAAAIYDYANLGFSSGEALCLMKQIAIQTLPAGLAFEWTGTAYQKKQVGVQASLSYPHPSLLAYPILAVE